MISITLYFAPEELQAFQEGGYARAYTHETALAIIPVTFDIDDFERVTGMTKNDYLDRDNHAVGNIRIQRREKKKE
jgi:hypothetical protein